MVEDFNYALGQRLRAARRHRGWSLGEVESNTDGEFKASVVGAYERGERAISVQRFSRLAEIYGTPASELLPAAVTYTGLTIDIDALSDGGGDLVERYLAAIQMLRKSPGVDEVRESDRVVISSLLHSAPTAPKD